MGVPAFFKWICARFPKIIKDAVDRDPISFEDGDVVFDGAEDDTPNGEFDNLYLDMNGIIHPCCHPEDSENPESEEHMFEAIFLYIDRILNIIRPKKLLYMAIDGVAPRAKMNQQRARRYRAAQEMAEAEEEEAELREQFIAEGRPVPAKKAHTVWDSNVITPGTKFMHRLAQALQWYVHQRYTNDPLWKRLGFRVILSDANLPGEGEHKIMDYIREQRSQPGYNPNIRHCLYGSDADLIMLGMATHEAHFFILREVVTSVREEKKCTICGKPGHVASECMGDQEEPEEPAHEGGEKKPFQILNVAVARQYLGHFYGVLENTLPFKYDLERCIDDFVFLCFFVGNDFMPHLPSLSIRDGSIDALMEMYVNLLPSLGDYITCDGLVNLEVTEQFLECLGMIEDDVFRNSFQKGQGDDVSWKKRLDEARTNISLSVTGGETFGESNLTKHVDPEKSAAEILLDSFSFEFESDDEDEGKEDGPGAKDEKAEKDEKGEKNEKGESKAEKVEKIEKAEPSIVKPESLVEDDFDDEDEFYQQFNMNPVPAVKEANVKEVKVLEDPKEVVHIDITEDEIREFNEQLKNRIKAKQEIQTPMDTIKLGEGAPTHWKQRYYFEKFRLEQEDLVEFLQRIRKAYIEGLCWVMLYYFQGCASWTWFYPYHYAPFSSDLIGCSALKCGQANYFSKGEIFKPFEQLMSVLPPSSAEPAGIPPAMIETMKDPLSPIVDFFPTNFALDLNNKRFMWQAVILLPFIDEQRLLRTISPLMKDLTEEEKKRNAFGRVYFFSHENDTTLREYVSDAQSLYLKNGAGDASRVDMDGKYCGTFGRVEGFEMGGVNPSIPSAGEIFPAIERSSAISGVFYPPPFHPHQCSMLEGVEPQKVIVMADEIADVRARKGFGGEQARNLVYTHLGHLFGKNTQQYRFHQNQKKKSEREARATEKRNKIVEEEGAAAGKPPKSSVPAMSGYKRPRY